MPSPTRTWSPGSVRRAPRAFYERLAARIRDDDRPEARAEVASALYMKGSALEEMGRFEDAIAAYDEVVNGFARDSESSVQASFLRAVSDKVGVLCRLERYQEAVDGSASLGIGPGGEIPGEARASVARGLWMVGVSLHRLRRWKEAVVAYREVVRRFGESEDPLTRQYCAEALFYQGLVLCNCLHRYEEALAVLREVVARYGGEAEVPAVRSAAVHAQCGVAVQLLRLGRRRPALRALRAAYRDVEWLDLREHALLESPISRCLARGRRLRSRWALRARVFSGIAGDAPRAD